jgi:hypothetical protein
VNAPGGPSHPRPSERPLGSIVAALVVVAAVAIVAWKSFASVDRDEANAGESAVVSSPSIASAAAEAEAAPQGAGTPEGGASGTELVEVCGVGWVQPDASGSIDGPLRSVPDVVASQRALLESLRQDDGELGVAVATFLELHGAGRGGAELDPVVSLYCKPPDCATNEEDRQFASTRIEQLASLASTTRDPRVYQLAMNACRFTPSVGSCALLNTGQWALLAEGNAAPWLEILQDAWHRGDAAQINEALYRIGAAGRYEGDSALAAGLIADRAKVQGADLIASELLAFDAFFKTVANPPTLQAITQVCSVAALADANRRQACDSAAATLAERSDSMLALTIGSVLGRRVGWSDDRVDSIRGLWFAEIAMHREGQPETSPENILGIPGSCDGARRVLARFSAQGRVGEVQAVRDWLSANGKPIGPYALQAHESRRRGDEREAANAALAAASAVAAAMPAEVTPASAAAAPASAPTAAASAATDAASAAAAPPAASQRVAG